MFKPGDAVLVGNDFSTPEEWEFPAIVKDVDDDSNPMIHVVPLNDTYFTPDDSGTLPQFPNLCKLLLKGKAVQTFTDKPNREFDAYLDPDTRKLYYKQQPEPQEPELDENAYFIADDGTKHDADSLTMIGDLEDQSHKDD